MILLSRVIWYLLRKQKYTILYFVMKKFLGPQLLHPCYSRPSFYRRLLSHLTEKKADYFHDPWVCV